MTGEQDAEELERGPLEVTSSEPTSLEPGLYLVATPIGNLEDITLRALRVLRSVDWIACEDTRHSQKLLNHFAISTATISCHEYNEHARAARLLEEIGRGGRVALISDAGTPGISDPGTVLVRAAIAAGLCVIPVPGANAALAALVASGLDTEQFLFAGFLPSKSGARRAQLADLAARLGEDPGGNRDPSEARTVVFYEAPHRIVETLNDIEAVWGPAVRVVAARELTKKHEEFLRGTAVEVRFRFQERDRVRGEIVLLVEARRPALEVEAARSIAAEVEAVMQAEGLDAKDALKRVARERGLSKSEAYRRLQQAKRPAKPRP